MEEKKTKTLKRLEKIVSKYTGLSVKKIRETPLCKLRKLLQEQS
jgi:hypothetical protein